MPGTLHRLIITSVGSLVGENIFDTIEGRRNDFFIIGLNTIANNPVVYRCDEALISPPSNSESFPEFLISMIDRFKPDFVLPGRDADVGVLAGIRQRRPDLSSLFPVGSGVAAEIMNDKLASAQFAEKMGLPFAPTIDAANQDTKAFTTQLSRLGYPLIAKPRSGSGSIGVKYILNEGQAIQLTRLYPDAYVFQPLINPPQGFESHCDLYLRDVDAGVPAFFHLPDDSQYAGQCMIDPEGRVGEIFCGRSLMVLGRCERAEKIDDPGMTEVVRSFASAFADIGWIGPFNIQGRMGANGFIAIEMNGRFSGSTSARSWMGYDEIRALYLAFRGFDIGHNTTRPIHSEGPVHRILSDMPLRDSNMATLSSTGYWQNGKRK